MSRPNWHGKRDELLLVNAATDRELDNFTQRDAAMQGRATLLIGAASLVGAIKLGEGLDWLAFINLILSFLAAVCGVIVLFPRTAGAPNPRQMWNAIYDNVSDEEALHHMIRVKLETLDDDERSLERRSLSTKIGFILLAVSVLIAAVGALLPEADRPPSPCETTCVSLNE